MAKPQDALDNIWGKYRISLTALSDALDENEVLKADADIDFTVPTDIAELEKRIESKLANGFTE
jgi:DNA-binding response OmpR family regulator